MVGLLMTLLLENGWICTMDDAETECPTAGCSLGTGSSRRSAAAAPPAADERVDLAGAVVTPGLVNTHHHLYQTLTRARAQEATLFEWLRELYPVWARIDAEAEHAAARTGLAELALSGLHNRLRPPLRLPARPRRADRGGGARRRASSACGSSPRAGSMDLGASDGGLPPD